MPMTFSELKELAKSGAKQICGGNGFAGLGCMHEYPCGHKNKHKNSLHMCGTNTICPLAKYSVKENSAEKNSFGWDRTVTDDELFALCHECDFAIKEDTERTFSYDNKHIFMSHCIDCPVEHVAECIQEQRAEAASS